MARALFYVVMWGLFAAFMTRAIEEGYQVFAVCGFIYGVYFSNRAWRAIHE